MDGGSLSVPYVRVMAAFDGSAGSTRALHRALLLARDWGTGLTVLSVDENVPRYAPGVGEVDEETKVRSAYFADIRDKASAIAQEYGTSIEIATALGHAGEAIVKFARDHSFDLIVIGHLAHTGLAEVILGSAEAEVVGKAPCDILVVR